MIVPRKVLDPIGPTAAAAAQRDNQLVDLLEVNHGMLGGFRGWVERAADV